MMLRLRPRLLVLTASAAMFSVVANGITAVTAATAPPPTRLGVAIQKDVSAMEAAATQRSRALDLREATARATEERLKADLSERKPASGKAGAGEAPEPDEQFDSLARVYQAMKPARAAAVLEQLDLDVQMQVAKRMRDRSTAMILGAMSPRGAATLSMALARKSAQIRPVRPPAIVTAQATPAPVASATPAPVASATPAPVASATPAAVLK